MTASMKIASLNESKMKLFEQTLNFILKVWGVILLGTFGYSVGYAIYQIITNLRQFMYD